MTKTRRLRNWKPFWFGLAVFSLVDGPVHGEDVTVALTGPAELVTAGEPIHFQLNALNTSSAEGSWTFPAKVQCHLVSSLNTADVWAHLADGATAGATTIAAGAFAQREYVVPLPETWSGEVTLETPGLSQTRLVLQLENPPSSAAMTNAPVSHGLRSFLAGGKPPPEGTSYNPDTFFKEHIFGYQPMYFIAGTQSPNAKFQISFRYRLLNDHGWLAQKQPWLTGLNVAYTQMSLWDWNGPSAPFYDTSYMPELLYYKRGLIGGGPDDWFRLDYDGGFHHESNGKAGADSRSMNLAYLRSTLVFGRDDGFQVKLIPRVWEYLGDLSDNPDMPDYRGYADLRAVFGWERGLQLSAWGRMGDDANHGSLQLDLTYPLMQPPAGSFSVYLQAQYFTGYAESLLGYRQRTDIFRVGISIYR